ncbi:hypothetical protein ACOMHN_051928 [Nucella lapillus]
MAQEEFDPPDMLSKVAMLVLEARTPHPSAKGRVEGPHCSQALEQHSRHGHLCHPELPEVGESMEVMWRNGIPTCVDILLFPNCAHGRKETYTLDGAGSRENRILLERWSIKCISTWQRECQEGVGASQLVQAMRQRECREGVGASQLVQAMRSYLHFSQLSSWLTSMHGHLPAHVAYRLYAPGDCGDGDFMQTPESHIFPTAVSSPHRVKVTVLHLPRLAQFPELRCAWGEPPPLGLDLLGQRLGWDDCVKEDSAEGGKGRKGGIRKRGRAARYAKLTESQSQTSASASNNQQQQMAPQHKTPPSSSPNTPPRSARDGITKLDQSSRKISPPSFSSSSSSASSSSSSSSKPNRTRRVREERPGQESHASPPDKQQQHIREVRRHLNDRRRALDHQKSAKSAAPPQQRRKTSPPEYKKRGLKVEARLQQTPNSKRPTHQQQQLPSPYRRPEDDEIERIFDDNFGAMSDDGWSREEDVRGGGGCCVKKSSTTTTTTTPTPRESLESQLRPLELTPPRPAPSLDLHSPKVLMSEVFYNPPPPPPPATHCMQLDFSHHPWGGPPRHPSAGPQYPSAGPQYPSAGPHYPSAGPQHPSAGPQYPPAGPRHPSAGPQYPSAGPQFTPPGPQHPSAGPQYTPTGPQYLRDKEFLIQHFAQGGGRGGLLSKLELSKLFFNLQPLTPLPLPIPPDPTTTTTTISTTPTLPYKVTAEKAENMATRWNWSQVQTSAQRRDGGDAQPSGLRRFQKALEYGSDLSAQTGSSPSVAETAVLRPDSNPASAIAESPKPAGEQGTDLPRCVSASNSLKRTSPELPTRKSKVKKKEGAVTQEWGEEEEEGSSSPMMESTTSSGIYDRYREERSLVAQSTSSQINRGECSRMVESSSSEIHDRYREERSLVAQRSSSQINRGDSSRMVESSSSEIHDNNKASTSSRHSTSASDPRTWTGRDAERTSRAAETQTAHPSSGQQKNLLAVEALSESWSSSSSSSSSSSTFSSSPRVPRESGGERHSDSSTPTNLSASPLPEDQQPCPVRSPADSVDVSVTADASSGYDGSRPSLGQQSTESRSLSAQESSDTVSKGTRLLETEAGGVRSSEFGNQKLQKEGGPQASYSSHLPEPVRSENVQNLEGGMFETENSSGSLSSVSLLSSSSCSKILTDVSHREKDHAQVSLSSKSAETKSTVSSRSVVDQAKSPGTFHLESCHSSPEKAKSPCKFYLESSNSSPEKVCQWERVLDLDDGQELASLLGKLCLQQTNPVKRSLRSPPQYGGEPQQPQSNGCAENGNAKYPSQGHSNGHLHSDDAAHNGSHLADDESVDDDESQFLSFGRLSDVDCTSIDSDCDFSLPIEDGDGASPGVSISNSSLVPPWKAVDQRQRVTKTGTQSVEPDSIEMPSYVFGSKGGARNNLTGVAGAHSPTDDSVFDDKACDVSAVTNCPTRTKSAPSFSCLSEMSRNREEEEEEKEEEMTRGRSALREKEILKAVGSDRLRHRLVKSASILFNSRGSLPSQSSPAPIKRRSTDRFEFDETLTSTKAIKSAISLSRLPDVSKDSADSLTKSSDRVLSTSAPASTNCLLGNFEKSMFNGRLESAEESMLNGRLEPAGVVEGFSIDVGASGKFCPRHVSLPVTSYFFNLSDDNAPSPYLGHINLDTLGKRGYHIPNVGTLQVTLFNPNKTVVKMFVVKYDLQDMPPNSQTVLRQRTVYQPLDLLSPLPSYLRYLIHLRISSSSSGKTYLHTDIRLIFARHKFELDSTEVQYKLCSYTETPINPKYSPKR